MSIWPHLNAIACLHETAVGQVKAFLATVSVQDSREGRCELGRQKLSISPFFFTFFQIASHLMNDQSSLNFVENNLRFLVFSSFHLNRAFVQCCSRFWI